MIPQPIYVEIFRSMMDWLAIASILCVAKYIRNKNWGWGRMVLFNKVLVVQVWETESGNLYPHKKLCMVHLVLHDSNN